MHTPGPWHTTEDGCGFYVEPAGDSTVAVCNVLPIDGKGALGDYSRGPVTRANACLVSAAPELLAALRSARVYVLDAYECAFPNETENSVVLKAIDGAIAKAEGGAA